MDKKIDIGSAAKAVGKGAKSLFEKAKDGLVNAVDQNDDGNFDMSDVSAIAESIETSAKNTVSAFKASAEAWNREKERQLLQPIFSDDLDSADFTLTKMIRVTEIDKRRAESEVCKGSIGYISEQKDLKIINIFKDKLDVFGLTFYPDADCELYYVDPSDRDKYIALDDYFSYLKVARVNELQKIAQDLGAKHFRVTYKEQKSSFSANSAKAKANAKISGVSVTADASHDLTSTAVSAVEVAAEMDCPGHEPSEPTLHYLQREPSIQSLITLRMDKDSPISHQKYTLKLSNSSGIKEKDAIKIDAALKAMKISGNTTVTSEVQNESRRFFEYEVDF
ncbi:MAG: hypothetical protein IJ017_03925 [Oscillospiraceae bacterium]|nr:hypothetical protein [Oscillospiraceae bacterium]